MRRPGRLSGLMMAHVHFVMRDLATKWPDLERLTELDVDVQPERMRTGVVNWVLQTYLHLRQALTERAVTSSVSEHIMPEVINIVHRDSFNSLDAAARRATIIGVRADRPPFMMADLEILQNDVGELLPNQFYIPFWPQPGLIPRSRARAERVEHMVYLGNTGTTSPWLSDPDFLAALTAIGVSFEIRERKWYDYSDIDLTIAHRREAPCMVVYKPASKLINAWFAGTPALLNDEPAYLKLRTDPLDYISIDSTRDVLLAIARLRRDPNLYRAMAERGRLRSAEFTVEATRARWLKVIMEEAIPRDAEIRASKSWIGQAVRLVSQKSQSRMFKLRYRREIESGARYRAPQAPGES